MSELSELYREVIMDHNRNPRNFGNLSDADRVIDAVNPLCGDKLKLYLKLDGDSIGDIAFEGSGCAISVASSSMMTERVRGMNVDDALVLYNVIHQMLTGEKEPESDIGKIAALGGVREFPSRIKCASLGWHALNSALKNDSASVTTE